VDERSLLEQFIAESDELVEALQQDLERLAAQLATGRANPDLLNRIFRSAHSLKGMAGMAGIDSVQRAAHRFEDLLDDMRMGRLKPDDRLVTACTRIAEDLAEMVASVASGHDAEHEAGRVAEAVDALRLGLEGSAVDDVEAALDLDDQVRKTLTEYEEHRLRENLRERRALYDVRVAFHLTEFDRGFRALNEQLAAQGEVISTLPGASGDDPMRIAFRMLYATDAPAEEVRAVVDPAGGTATCISHYEAAAEPDFAPVEAGSVSPSVRVEIRALDDLAVLAEGLAHRTSDLAGACSSMAERLGLGAREQFDFKQLARSLERGFAELEDRLVELRLVPLASAFARARRRVLKLAADLGRDVEVVTEGDEVRLDKAIVDRIAEPLSHLLNNAVDHGLEPPETREAAGKPRRGRVTLRAELRGNRVAIAVEDDGRGLDAEALDRAAAERGIEGHGIEVAFQPGVSTASVISEISGRGVGLDAVSSAVAALGGEVSVASEPGRGSLFEITLPTTLVMVSAFFVESGGEIFAIDVNQIAELALVEPAAVVVGKIGPTIAWRDTSIPLFVLAHLVGAHGDVWERQGRLPCLVARLGDRLAAIAVDRFITEREAVVKSLGRHAPRLRGVAGAVDVDAGRVALLIDLPALVGERRRVVAARG
jgi:two-component system chemotaxis sensor kinase CheA